MSWLFRDSTRYAPDKLKSKIDTQTVGRYEKQSHYTKEVINRQRAKKRRIPGQLCRRCDVWMLGVREEG